MSKNQVYSNFLDQLILRLGDNLVDIGDKSFLAIKNIVNEYTLNDKSPLNSKNLLLNILSHRFHLFKP